MSENGNGNSVNKMMTFKAFVFLGGLIVAGLSGWMAAIQAAVNAHADKIAKVETAVAVSDTKMDEIIRRLYFIELKMDPSGFVPKPKMKQQHPIEEPK